MKRYQKGLILIFTLLLAFLFGAIGCGSKKTASSVTLKQIDDKVKAVTDVSNMKVGDAAKLKKLYDIDASQVEDFVLYTAPINIKADEIAILKVKDSNEVQSIKDKISKRIEKQSESFKSYLPDEYSLVEKNVLKSKGKFVIFAVSKDSEKIESEFDKLVK